MKQKDRANLERSISSERWGFLRMWEMINGY